jgi:hypothetical protein
MESSEWQCSYLCSKYTSTRRCIEAAKQLDDGLGVKALPNDLRHHNVHERVVEHLQEPMLTYAQHPLAPYTQAEPIANSSMAAGRT